MKKLVLTAVISALSLNAAYAYQVELNGNATYENIDGSNGSTDFFGLGTGNSGIQGKDKPGIQKNLQNYCPSRHSCSSS